MQNEKHTPTQHAPVQNTEKKGESGAINELTENEDEGSCGCGDSSQADDTTDRQEDLSQSPFASANLTRHTQKQDRPADFRTGQDTPRSQRQTQSDEADASDEQGTNLGRAEDQTRSHHQLGDPDDNISAETRRKESAAEDAEKYAGEDEAA